MRSLGCKCPVWCGTTERSLESMRLHGKCVGSMGQDADGLLEYGAVSIRQVMKPNSQVEGKRFALFKIEGFYSCQSQKLHSKY